MTHILHSIWQTTSRLILNSLSDLHLVQILMPPSISPRASITIFWLEILVFPWPLKERAVHSTGGHLADAINHWTIQLNHFVQEVNESWKDACSPVIRVTRQKLWDLHSQVGWIQCVITMSRRSMTAWKDACSPVIIVTWQKLCEERVCSPRSNISRLRSTCDDVLNSTEHTNEMWTAVRNS